MTLLRTIIVSLALCVGLASTPAAAQSWVEGHEPTLQIMQIDRPPLPDDWVTVTGPVVTVHGPPSRDRLLVELSDHANQRALELANELDVPLQGTIEVHLAANNEQFKQLQPGKIPTWADGVAYPVPGLIYLRDPSVRGGKAKPLTQVLDHELVHVLLGRAFAPHHPPAWLQEGVAQVMAGEYSPDTVRQLAKQTLAREPLSLESLSRGFPSGALDAQLAYAQSADLISYLQGTYGPDVLPKLIKSMAKEGNIHKALYQSTGDLLEEIDAAWRSGFESGPGLSITQFASDEWIWAFGGLMLLGGGWMRRRQFIRRLKEMEEEERLVDELASRLTGRPTPPPPSRRWDPKF